MLTCCGCLTAPTPTSDRQCGYADEIECSIEGDWLLPEARGLYTTRLLPRPQSKQEPRHFTTPDARFHLVLRSLDKLPPWVREQFGEYGPTLPAWFLLELSAQRVHAYWEATTPDKPDQILALTPQHMPYKPARVVLYTEVSGNLKDSPRNSAHEGWQTRACVCESGFKENTLNPLFTSPDPLPCLPLLLLPLPPSSLSLLPPPFSWMCQCLRSPTVLRYHAPTLQTVVL